MDYMLGHGMSASPWCGLDADGYIRILFLSYAFCLPNSLHAI